MSCQSADYAIRTAVISHTMPKLLDPSFFYCILLPNPQAGEPPNQSEHLGVHKRVNQILNIRIIKKEIVPPEGAMIMVNGLGT